MSIVFERNVGPFFLSEFPTSVIGGISVLPDLHLLWRWLYCILREKCRDLRSFFWSVFSGVWTEYGYLSGDKCIQLDYRKITGEKKHCFRTHFTQWYMLILKILSSIVFSNIKKNVQATRKGPRIEYFCTFRKIFSYDL